MSRIIIGIHGLGNKPPAPLLESWWRKSIHEGLGRIGKPHPFAKFELVYWARHIYEKPLDYNLTDPDDPLFIPDPYIPASGNPQIKIPGIRRRLFDYLEKQFDKIFLSDDHMIDVSGITDMIISHFFKDLHVYFTTVYAKGKIKPGKARRAIQRSLQQVLRKHQGKQILLIAHSMGSIIAFDVLSKSESDISVNTLITIGSPLGIPAIKQKLLAESNDTEKLHTPDSVRYKWCNFSDPEDRVAFDHDLNDDFLPNSNGVSPYDQEIYNDYIMNGERNAHKAYGYLRTAPVADAIAEFLDHGISRPGLWLRSNLNLFYAQFRRHA
jgi:hypothetical protein